MPAAVAHNYSKIEYTSLSKELNPPMQCADVTDGDKGETNQISSVGALVDVDDNGGDYEPL